MTDSQVPVVRTAATPKSLLEAMAHDLASMQDPWARHWLTIPVQGWGEWLLRYWAEMKGIASRSQLVMLRSLVELAASGTDRSSYSLSSLQMSVASVLYELKGKLPLPPDLVSNTVDSRTMGWARLLAEGVDLGLLCRDEFFRTEGSLGPLFSCPQVMESIEGHLGKLESGAFLDSTRQWVESWRRRADCLTSG